MSFSYNDLVFHKTNLEEEINNKQANKDRLENEKEELDLKYQKIINDMRRELQDSEEMRSNDSENIR